jgi:hypothetical protein
MRIVKISAVAAGLTLAGAAHAQGSPPAPAPAPAPTVGTPAGFEMNNMNEHGREYGRLNNDVAGRRAGPTRSSRPVPIVPEDVTVGSDVRDSKGVVLGKITSVGMDFAVITSPLGKIEIEFESLAKNNKGLMINMPKARFDALLTGKPN